MMIEQPEKIAAMLRRLADCIEADIAIALQVRMDRPSSEDLANNPHHTDVLAVSFALAPGAAAKVRPFE